jgi:WD40 repeat protein
MRAHPRTQPAKWWTGLSSFPFRFAFGRAFNLAFGIAAVVTLFLTTGTVLAQSALPGNALYGWKIASEEVLRTFHPDPLAVDLMVAKRRIYDLTQVMGNPEAEELARQEYGESLARLLAYTTPVAQEAISVALVEQKADLEQAHIVVPELEQLLDTFDEEQSVPDDAHPINLWLDYKPVTVEAGLITYRLTLDNRSPFNPITTTLVSQLSPAESLVSVEGADCHLSNEGRLTCAMDHLAQDTPRELIMTTTVDPCYAGTVTNIITVAGTEHIINAGSDNRMIIESNVSPSFPASAKVAYIQSDNRNHNLGLVTSGAGLLNDDLHTRAAAPAWSPDGSKLAFFGVEGISELGGIYNRGNGVWLMDVIGVQGRNLRQLVAQDHIKNIAWSPDGRRLAFEVGPPGLPHEVIVIDARNGQEFSRFPGEQPAWSPNSQKLVIKNCGPQCGLWQVDLDGSDGEQLTFDGTDSYPNWSSDGQYLVFTSQTRHNNWEIYRLHLADNEIVRLTNRPGTDTTPVFGPCGQEIYLRTDQYKSWWITVMKLDGSDEYKIKEDVGPTDDWGLARPAIH